MLQEDFIEISKSFLDKAQEKNIPMLLPIDHICAPEFNAVDKAVEIDSIDIPDDLMALDIGPKSIKLFSDEIAKAKTIVWNGPMGVFEKPEFAKGTFAIADAVADSDSVSIIGGGDSVSAVKKAGVADKVSHISTGGGASLEYLQGKVLPGIAALTEK
jgi:phosphoglycerate kinase